MTNTITTMLQGREAIAGHRPWPRYAIDAATWEALGAALAAGEGTLLGLWGDAGAVHMALTVPSPAAPSLAIPAIVTLATADGTFPSIGKHHAPAIRLERAVRDLYGYVASGAPDRRGWLDHGAWGVAAPLGARVSAPLADPVAYDFSPVHGEGLHQIPVGPVHAGIIEPGHFRFTANGELVARLEERLGYVHKGIDGLLNDCDLDKAARIVARVSGDSTVAASFAFARAVEAARGIEAPPRAVALRGLMAELERVANHLGDIGGVCNDAAFALILAYCGILREKVLAACDRVFGHRLMMDMVVPGGVACDPTPSQLRLILTMLDAVAPLFADVVEEYGDTPSLQDRTCTTGIVTSDLVAKWGVGGHVGRASGRDFDARRNLAYAPYQSLGFLVPVFMEGDVDARVRVRIREVEASMEMIRTLIDKLPDGPVRTDAKGVAAGEGVAVTEAFRGDLLVWLRLDGDRVARCHVRDASWFQWPLLEAAIENNIVADFPLCNKSFNCSYSGHDL
jgi:Ni,Fe-hydrogenase III large subunit